MHYVLLMYADESAWANASPAEQAAEMELHDRLPDRAAELGITLTGGEALRTAATATTLRRRGTEITVTDGPFAETVEQLGGFYLAEAGSLDDVLKLAAHLPEYVIEIRPIDSNPGG